MPLTENLPPPLAFTAAAPGAASSGETFPGLSLTLDAWRLAAALTVVLCHFSSRRMSGGLLWQATPYGAEAVDVFFVLSGYVIAHVADTRERDLAHFATSRAARLWSVAVPAAALTFALDALGRVLAPALYAALPGHPEQLSIAWQAAAGLLFFNRAWWLAIPVGANVPWWSLGYEVPYYLAFAFLRFGSGFWRVAGPLLIAALAGPSICLLAVLWFAGAAIWQVHRGRPPAHPRSGAWALTAALLPLPLWLLYEAACQAFERPLAPVPALRPEIPQDLLVGGLFALHLLGAPALLARLPACPVMLARAIRFGAARSFSIYLLHYPMMLCLRAAGLHVVLLLPVTLGCCLAVAEVTERRKAFWNRALRKLGGLQEV